MLPSYELAIVFCSSIENTDYPTVAHLNYVITFNPHAIDDHQFHETVNCIESVRFHSNIFISISIRPVAQYISK